MWLLLARDPAPDVCVWPGRRWLAAADVLAWPLLFVLVVHFAPFSTGAVGPLAIALATLSAVRRFHLALWLNQRYRFTTWRWGRVTALLLVAGAVLKLLAQL